MAFPIKGGKKPNPFAHQPAAPKGPQEPDEDDLNEPPSGGPVGAPRRRGATASALKQRPPMPRGGGLRGGGY